MSLYRFSFYLFALLLALLPIAAEQFFSNIDLWWQPFVLWFAWILSIVVFTFANFSSRHL